MMLPYPPDQLMLMAMCLPLIAAMMMPLLRNLPNVREFVSVGLGVALFVCVWQMQSVLLPSTAHVLRDISHIRIGTFLPGVDIAFSASHIGLMFALISSFLWPITTIYAAGYLRKNGEASHSRFFACFSLAIFCAQAIAFSDNLLTTFVFYEMMTLCTLPLVMHHGSALARSQGRIYLGVLMGASVAFLFPAIIWIWMSTGTLTFTPGGIIGDAVTGWPLVLLVLLAMFGTAKAALMPLHRWLPAAMVAPTPVSALLHAVAVVKAGVFLAVRMVTDVFGVDLLAAELPVWMGSNLLTWLALSTMLLASLVAMRQDAIKRRLAYSTISQLAYVVMAVSLLKAYALAGALLHIAAHAFGKITLFFAAGNIYSAAGKKYVSELDGLGRVMPLTFVAFGVGALSMIGIPPAVGFYSKFYMVTGAMADSQWLVLAALAISTVLNAYYLLPILYRAFFVRRVGRKPSHKDAPVSMLLAISITAIMTIGLLCYPDFLMRFADVYVTTPIAE